MTYFYLSFATDKGFRGATVVDADDPDDAINVATSRGLNPGGEIAIFEVSPEAEAEPDFHRMKNRFCGRDEMIAHGGVRSGDLPQDERDKFDANAIIVCDDCNKE